jgi:hypothetical protein
MRSSVRAEHLLTLGLVHAERLFHQHVAPGAQRRDAELDVRPMRRRNDDGAYIGASEQLFGTSRSEDIEFGPALTEWIADGGEKGSRYGSGGYGSGVACARTAEAKNTNAKLARQKRAGN